MCKGQPLSHTVTHTDNHTPTIYTSLYTGLSINMHTFQPVHRPDKKVKLYVFCICYIYLDSVS